MRGWRLSVLVKSAPEQHQCDDLVRRDGPGGTASIERIDVNDLHAPSRTPSARAVIIRGALGRGVDAHDEDCADALPVEAGPPSLAGPQRGGERATAGLVAHIRESADYWFPNSRANN